MTLGFFRPRRAIVRFSLLATASLVPVALGEIAARQALHPSAELVRVGLQNQARLLEEFFGRMLRDARRVAEKARDDSPIAAVREASATLLEGRLEGAARIGPGGSFEDWEGTPSEPDATVRDSLEPSYKIRPEGVATRLVVATAPDTRGRRGSCSFLLDRSLGDSPFEDLLPRGFESDSPMEMEFLPGNPVQQATAGSSAETWLRARDGEPMRVSLALRSPPGTPLASAMLSAPSPSYRASQRRTAGNAAAALVFVVLLAVLFEWRTLCQSLPGVLAAMASLMAARAALIEARVPARILPRELGAPGLFGRADVGGLLGSPADLLASGLFVLLAALALKEYLGRLSERRPRVSGGVAALAAIGTIALVQWLSLVLARDTRLPLLHFAAPEHLAGRTCLLVGLTVTILAAAELVVAAWRISGWGARRAPLSAGHPAVVLALLPLCALSSTTLLRTSEALASERLRSEFAPQVLEQNGRRRVTLTASVEDAAVAETASGTLSAPPGEFDRYAAYQLWVTGDLFHQGYLSSIDLYDTEGRLRSHFGFGVPPLEDLEEARDPLDRLGVGLEIREEEFRVGATRQRVVHAEMAVEARGVRIGTVIGHVLDEPENLPFLPQVAPYLASLGPGAPPVAQEDLAGAPGYVLYDKDGDVLVSTLHQPPAAGEALRNPAASNRTVRIDSGEEAYVGLPLVDGGRLHLLLFPSFTFLESLGAFTRLSLLGLLALAGLVVFHLGVRGIGIRALAEAVQRSFYRKLLATVLLVSVVPVVGLSVFLRGYVERQAEAGLVESAAGLVSVVQRVVADYVEVQSDTPDAAPPPLTDEILSWLRRVVRQEIHLYENGRLTASSKRELFASGLLPARIPGEVHRRVVRGGLPYLVLSERLGDSPIPVAYARVELPGPDREAVVAVPLVLQRQESARAVRPVVEMLLLASVLLGSLLAGAAAGLARTISRPVREMARATGRISSGDYGTRLETRSRDEVGELVVGFNAMASALGSQRADLERRRDYMEALLRHATTGVVSTDVEGRIVTLNPAAAGLLAGSQGPPTPGQNLVEVLSRDPELGPLARTLAHPPSPIDEPVEVDLHRVGQARRLRVMRVDLPDPTGGPAGTLLLVDDVTDLMRSNQLAAWAEMARAIAHEIKNPLTPIQLSTEHLRRVLRDRAGEITPDVEACLETVIKQVRALREIASEFSTYSRLPTLTLEPTDPVALLAEVAAPYKAAHPPGVVIEELYAAAPQVAVDRRVLSRALVNLLENALQAVPEGGKITLATRAGDDGREAVLSVSDTGSGLDPAARERLFEPYFSTKSSGTGLGLAIVHRAVQAHRGHIELESEPGQGCAFHIHLPACGAG